MTQDQDQRGPGSVVRDDAVTEDETQEYDTQEYPAEQGRPMTRFQKVASALRGTGTDRDEQDEATRDGHDQAFTNADQDAQARRDYWDEPGAAVQPADTAASRPVDPAARRDEGVAVMDPDVPVDETHPDVPAVPAAEGQPGAATIADVPAGASVPTATGTREAVVPEAGVPEADVAGSTGRPAAAAPTDHELRPGEATVSSQLGDFSDLTYGNLVPDAEQFTAKWQAIQFKFVDDPHASVTEAADVVAQVTAKMEAAIQERQRAIAERQRAIAEQQQSLRGRWGESSNTDTENLRETLRMYKTFLDQLIGPKAS